MLKQPLTYDSSFTLPTGFTHSPPSFPTKFGGAGERDWTEAEESHTNRETVLRRFLKAQVADLQQLLQQDPVLGPVLAAKSSDIKERSMQALLQQYPRLFLNSGVFHRRQADQRRGTLEQLVLPSSHRPDVLASFRDDMSAPWSY